METTMNITARRALGLLSVTAFLVTLTACTTKLTPNPTDTTSSTTPGAFFTQDGLLKDDQKVNAFVAFNFENLKDEMARGQGEYLTSLGTLLGVREARHADFLALAREKYPVLVPSEQTTPDQLVAALARELSANPSLTR
jgi:hypothetical protein